MMGQQDDHKLTVEDVRKMALPLGTRVLAGEGLLHKPVAWLASVSTDDTRAHKALQPGELVLATGDTLSDQAATALVRWAYDQGASAVVLAHMPPPSAIAEANAYGLPLLLLGNAHTRQVEKTIISLLVDRRGHLERRGTQIYRQLTEISSRNEGMTGLVDAMARLTNKSVVVQDKRLKVFESRVQPPMAALWDDIEADLRKPDMLPVEFADRHRVTDIANPMMMQALRQPGMVRLIAPIITKDIGRGFLSVIGRESDFDAIDDLVVEHGAAACALEMAKAKAVSDTEKRLRGTFLDRVLSGDVSPQEAKRQGERLEHAMERCHVAIALAWRGDKTPSLRRLETLVNSVVSAQRAAALVWQREREDENEVLVYHATDLDAPVDTSMRLAEAFASEVQRQHHTAHVAIGLGQPAYTIGEWRSSYKDSRQAMELAQRLQTDTPLYIGSLGVYQLILSLSDKEREKLIAFKDRTLRALEDYDHRQHADLIKTLEAFFACHGNLSETAKMLIVHRNTLLYRMNRIAQTAQVDLERPETRLALHLALTIRRLLEFG